MKKRFLEAMPELSVPKELEELLEDVWLEKVTQSQDRRLIRLYISSDHLIPKKQIYTLEGHIKQQLFPQRPLLVNIIEHYDLSAQYTPEVLWNLHRDSILLECLYQGKILQRILDESEVEFPRDHLVLVKLAQIRFVLRMVIFV